MTELPPQIIFHKENEKKANHGLTMNCCLQAHALEEQLVTNWLSYFGKL